MKTQRSTCCSSPCREIDVRPKGSNMILTMHLFPPFPSNIKLALEEEAVCGKCVLSTAQFSSYSKEYLLLLVACPFCSCTTAGDCRQYAQWISLDSLWAWHVSFTNVDRHIDFGLNHIRQALSWRHLTLSASCSLSFPSPSVGLQLNQLVHSLLWQHRAQVNFDVSWSCLSACDTYGPESRCN